MTIEIDLPADLISALDASLAGQPGQTRNGVFQQALRDWLIANGQLSLGDEGLRPDQLNTENDG